jgi:hypothetical protein
VKSDKKKTLVPWLSLIAAVVLGGCATERSEFDKGYDLGSSDIAKRQYWAIQNLQKQQSLLQRQGTGGGYRTVSIPVHGKNSDGSNISEHYVNVRVIER